MQLELPFLLTSSLEPRPQDPVAGLSGHAAPDQPPDSGTRTAPVIFVRARCARRYILRIQPDGTLRVTVPRWGSKREAQAFVERQRRWIERERTRVLAEHGPREWGDGSIILLRGEAVRITLEAGDSGHAILYGGRRVFRRNGGSVRDAIEMDLRDLARHELVPRLQELAALHGLPVGRVLIRNQRSRWGSCSPVGAIALNFRLVQMPPAIRDYVLVHELMHLREQNHSRRFWRLVERACPSFREAEGWLKVRGKALF